MTWRTEALYLICNVIVTQFLLDKYFLDVQLQLLLAALLLPVMVLTPLLSDPAEDALFPKLSVPE